MEVIVEKIIGRLGPGRWAQVHDFVPEDGERREKKGRLVAVMSLEAPLSGASAGKEVLTRLHELYYGSEEGPLPALKRAVETVTSEFEGAEVVGMAFVGEAIYIDGGRVWVKMGEKEGWIGASAVSGWAQDGEVLVGGNARFWECVMVGAVRAAVESGDAAETLGTMVYGSEKGEGAVGAVIKITNHKSQITNEVPEVQQRRQLDSLPAKLKNVVEKLVERLPKRAGLVYVEYQDKARARKRTMWVGVGFLVVLLTLVGGWQFRKREIERKTSELNMRIEEMVYKYNEAKALVDLNPARSRELLAEIDQEIKGLSELRGAEKDQRFKEIKNGFGEVLGMATGVKKAEVEEVLDLDLIRKGMVGRKLEIGNEKLVVLDTGGDRLVVVDPEKKSGEVVAGKEALGDARLLAVYPGKVTVLSDKGIVECETEGWKCAAELPESEEEVIDMGMFGGNIYLLGRDKIFRHQVVENGYGAEKEWTKTENGTSMAIDGSIWVMAGKNILKYTRGVREEFEVVGLDREWGENAVIYTDGESEKLYVLDKSNGRVVVIKKTGEYESQYVNEKFKEAGDLVVGDKVYVLAGSRIYENNK